jgi:transcriptional regulator with XRE-family HTH domain
VSTPGDRAAADAGPRLGFYEAKHAADAMRRLREAQKLSQRDLAVMLGKTASWVSFRETGATRLREGDAAEVAAALGTSLAGLIGGAP